MNIKKIKLINKKSPSGTLNKKNRKVKNIIKQINKKNHNIKLEKYSIIVTPKNFNITKKYIVVTSHIDTVYPKTFSFIKNKILFGTLDNSVTNYIMLNLLNEIINSQIVFCFTDCEETSMAGINETITTFNDSVCFIVLDVTTNDNENIVATIENDKFQINKTKQPDFIKIIPYDKCLSDEAKIVCEKNKLGFSVCLPCVFVNNQIHNDYGGRVSLQNIEKYKSFLIDTIKMLI